MKESHNHVAQPAICQVQYQCCNERRCDFMPSCFLLCVLKRAALAVENEEGKAFLRFPYHKIVAIKRLIASDLNNGAQLTSVLL